MGDAKNPPRRTVPGREADALMARIDRALAAWPAAEPGAIERDAKVDGIVAKAMEEGSGDLSEPDLLRPPLPAASGEGGEGRSKGSRGGVRLWLMAGGIAAATAAAVAAGVAFTIRLTAPGEAYSLAAGSRFPAPGAAPGSRTVQAVPAPAPATLDSHGIDPSQLPLASTTGARSVSPAASVRSAGAGRAAAPAVAATPPDPADTPAFDDSLQPAAAVGAGSSLAGGAGSVPRRPSMGAIQGAFGAALPAARACLGPGDPPYRATVTFQSDGAVRDVSFHAERSGSADRQAAAESCVRSALAGVRVPPFAEGTYSAPLTVRY